MRDIEKKPSVCQEVRVHWRPLDDLINQIIAWLLLQGTGKYGRLQSQTRANIIAKAQGDDNRG